MKNDEKFKSYYVVWKPNLGSSKEICTEKFKSYYVVWKLCAGAEWHKNARGFKSYYVVWKQDWTAAMKYVELSLNRTM